MRAGKHISREGKGYFQDSTDIYIDLSSHLSVPEQQVKNRRTKWKKVERITNECATSTHLYQTVFYQGSSLLNEAGRIMKKKPYGDITTTKAVIQVNSAQYSKTRVSE